ncbi:hypothetical protein Bpfe_011962, partial [Biomphalaria pfeifferi]
SDGTSQRAKRKSQIHHFQLLVLKSPGFDFSVDLKQEVTQCVYGMRKCLDIPDKKVPLMLEQTRVACTRLRVA